MSGRRSLSEQPSSARIFLARGTGIFLSPDLHLLINEGDKPEACANSLVEYVLNALISITTHYQKVMIFAIPSGNLPKGKLVI